MDLWTWLKRRRAALDEDDFQDEIRAHLAMAERDRLADGVDPEEARYAALREFGNVRRATEDARRVWTPRWLEYSRDLAADVRYAMRTLLQHKAFSLTVVGVLTIGIGLNAAVFTMLKGFALAPLAGVDHSARLHVVYAETSTGRQLRISYPDYQYLKAQVPAFEDLMGSNYFQATLGRGRHARPLSAELVTGNYFTVLGVQAHLGRTIQPADESGPGRDPVVVLGHGLWRREFGADPTIVGRTIEINNFPLTVVGVAAPSFHGTILSYDIEAFLPVTMVAEMGLNGGRPETPAAALLGDRQAGLLFPHAFLRREATRQSASAQVAAAWDVLKRERPSDDATQALEVVPLSQSPTGGQTVVLPLVTVLIVMGLLLLLVACANIAGLVLVRGLSRRGEVAVRLALGASRSRIIRLLVIENLVLAAPGAALGLMVSWLGIPPLIGYAEWAAAPQRLYLNAEVDALVIGFSAAVACACALTFGLVPAIQSSRIDLLSVINADATPRGAARGRLRAALVVAQVAVSLMLLVGAGLAGRSLDAAERAYPGFERDHLTALRLDVQENGYDEARGRVFYRRLLEAARSDPEFQGVTLATYSPVAFLETRSTAVEIDGHPLEPGQDPGMLFNAVGPDYFRTLKIPLAAGREFDDRDEGPSAAVAIVNRTLAESDFGEPANALGRRIRVGGTWRTIVGVASDVIYLQVNERPRPYVYIPFFQAYRPAMMLHTRGRMPDHALIERTRALVESIDPDLPIHSARPMSEVAKGTIFFRFMATMLFAFGVAGMALAALGTYGLVSYVVRQSTREIGIRMALGATATQVVGGFLAQGLRLGAVGIALGVVSALGVGRLLSGILYGVSATDGSSYGRALVLVLAVVLVATAVPARRASRTSPLTALRHQ